ncbi:divergent polysaccharide deacetylase family protein [Haliea atlantica]
MHRRGPPRFWPETLQQLSLLALLILPVSVSSTPAPDTSGAAAPRAATTALQQPLPGKARQPRLVIIIDDIGNSLRQGRAIVELPGKLNIAVLPHTPHGASLAAQAHREGKEILLHAPMSARNGKSPGAGALTPDMDQTRLRQTLAEALASVPHARGVNNHMGSEMTADAQAMRWLMQLLREQGLYFVDSRTHKGTVAALQAQAAGLPHLSRQVFLDNLREPDAILERLEAAIARAREEGLGVAIGHPYPETAAVLRNQLPTLARRGVSLALVSEALGIGVSGPSRPPAEPPENHHPGPLDNPVPSAAGTCLPAPAPRPPLRRVCSRDWQTYLTGY